MDNEKINKVLRNLIKTGFVGKDELTDIEIGDTTQHFSYTTEDQNNIKDASLIIDEICDAHHLEPLIYRAAELEAA